MIRIDMPVTVHIESTITIRTPFGHGSVTVVGPVDADKDGDPEITVRWDLPGQSLDGSATAELPLADMLGPPAHVAAMALEAAGVPGLAVLVTALRALV